MPTTAAGPAPADAPPITIPRGAAHRAAEHELSRPAYHDHDPNLVQRATDWFWNHAEHLIEHAAGATPGGWVGLTVVAAGVALAAVALRLRLGRLRTPATAARALFPDHPLSAAEHRIAAEHHAAAERWDDAVRERMRAVVRALEERALLDHRPGRTADEATADAAHLLPDHADSLRRAARAFDDVRYGGRHATEHTYRELRTLDGELERARPRITAGSPG